MKVRDLIEYLTQNYDPHETVCYTLWTYEDVYCTARDMHIRLSPEECYEILEKMERNHDCEIGINWDVLRCHIQDYAEEE